MNIPIKELEDRRQLMQQLFQEYNNYLDRMCPEEAYWHAESVVQILQSSVADLHGVEQQTINELIQNLFRN